MQHNIIKIANRQSRNPGQSDSDEWTRTPVRAIIICALLPARFEALEIPHNPVQGMDRPLPGWTDLGHSMKEDFRCLVRILQRN